MLRIHIAIWSLFLLASCQKSGPEYVNRFSDGQLQKIYDLQDRQDSKRLIPFLKAKKAAHREAAALAFASIQDTNAVRFLKVNMFTDLDKSVRKAAAYSIGQLRDTNNVGILFMAWENEIEPEVRKTILVSLGKSANQQVVDYLDNFRTGITVLRQGHTKAMFQSLWKRKVGEQYVENAIEYLAPTSSDETRFYAACLLSRMPKKFMEPHMEDVKILAQRNTEGEIGRLLGWAVKGKEKKEKTSFEEFKASAATLTDKPYKLAQRMLQTGFASPEGLEYLKNEAFEARFQVVRTTAAEVYFSSLNPIDRETDQHKQFVKSCIRSRDMALQSHACYEIFKHADSTYLDLLRLYKDSLAMPKQLETYIDFEKAIASITDQEYAAPDVKSEHYIDWQHVLSIPEKQQVLIETNKGNVLLDLFVNDAPGSVSNFLKLVQDSFYNGKYFHRVVKNFVVQAGCPRGDGWGALDWTQRSEFSNYQTYSTGTFGLASAGKDTEGVQWFITHNATPFLDGRYTILGRVHSGMDVIQNIEVGDKVLKINIL